MLKSFCRELPDVVRQEIFLKTSQLIAVDHRCMLQSLTLAYGYLRGEADAYCIDRRTQNTICFGVQQLLSTDDDKAPRFLRITVLRLANTVNLASPESCGWHRDYSASQSDW